MAQPLYASPRLPLASFLHFFRCCKIRQWNQKQQFTSTIMSFTSKILIESTTRASASLSLPCRDSTCIQINQSNSWGGQAKLGWFRVPSCCKNDRGKWLNNDIISKNVFPMNISYMQSNSMYKRTVPLQDDTSCLHSLDYRIPKHALLSEWFKLTLSMLVHQ